MATNCLLLFHKDLPRFSKCRSIDGKIIYPQALTGNVYLNSEIFSSALMRLFFKLGKDTTDLLTLETLYYLTDGLNMPQAAKLFIKADTTLFGGVHTEVIWRTFSETHILPWMTGITKTQESSNEIKIINSLNFAQGRGNLFVSLPKAEEGTFILTNNLGQVIMKENFSSDQFSLASRCIKIPGIYYLTINTPAFRETRKILVE